MLHEVPGSRRTLRLLWALPSSFHGSADPWCLSKDEQRFCRRSLLPKQPLDSSSRPSHIIIKLNISRKMIEESQVCLLHDFNKLYISFPPNPCVPYRLDFNRMNPTNPKPIL